MSDTLHKPAESHPKSVASWTVCLRGALSRHTLALVQSPGNAARMSKADTLLLSLEVAQPMAFAAQIGTSLLPSKMWHTSNTSLRVPP